MTDPDGTFATQILASLATPSFTGIELGGGVFARPALAATGGAGEGISPYGVDTGISCETNSNICNASLGQMCVGATCLAFPVVKKDATIVLRGYNFWDTTDARLVFDPLVPGPGQPVDGRHSRFRHQRAYRSGRRLHAALRPAERDF